MNRAPAPSSLARAVCHGLTGAAPRGFTLVEIMLAMGGLALISTAGFVVYQGVANNADVRTEQANVQRLANNADKVYGALGSFQGLTTAKAILDKVPPGSMVAGAGLVSRWKQPVLVEPTAVDGKPNAGLRITYQGVPARACLKFAQAASEGMYDTQVAGQSVMSRGRFNPEVAAVLCADAVPVEFTYSAGTSGLAAGVLPPVSLPPLNSPPAAPPVAPPSAPPPIAPPPPPAAPGCGAAPAAPATGTTPAGQTCSFLWTATSAPTCWVSQALCVSNLPPPSTPPPTSPPSTPPPTSPPSPPPTGTLCVAPPATTEPDGRTASCPAGTMLASGGTSFAQSRTRQITWSCPDPFGAPVSTPGPWSAWSPDASSVCVPSCSTPSPTSTPITRAAGDENQTLGCPAGQTGAITQTRARTENGTRTTSWSCPGPTSSTSDSWSGTYAYGAWTTTANTCAPTAKMFRSCGTTSIVYTWSKNGKTCSGGKSLYGMWYLNEGESIPIWGFPNGGGATVGGQAKLKCDTAAIEQLKATQNGVSYFEGACSTMPYPPWFYDQGAKPTDTCALAFGGIVGVPDPGTCD